MSSKPKGLKSSEESPTGVSGAKERGVGKPKERAGQVRAPSPTRGHNKAFQRVEDLWQNEGFRKDLATILHLVDPQVQAECLYNFARDNGLDLRSGSSFVQLPKNEEDWPQNPDLDFCHIVDEFDEVLNDRDEEYWMTQTRPRPNHRLSIVLYPIHISISPFASKRDVLDFVAKKWSAIRSLLDVYGDMYSGKKPSMRKRRKAERDQFIWGHREVPSATLADMVCKEFPGELLTYADINAIKHYLKKRYSRL